MADPEEPVLGPGAMPRDVHPVVLVGAAAALHVANLDQLRRVVAQLPRIRPGTGRRASERGAELAGLITGILDLYRPALEAYVGEVERLAPGDRGSVEIVLDLPEGAAAAAEQLLGLLEAADELAHRHGLGNLAAPHDVRRLRRWMTTEIGAQLTTGRAPFAFPGTVDPRPDQ